MTRTKGEKKIDDLKTWAIGLLVAIVGYAAQHYLKQIDDNLTCINDQLGSLISSNARHDERIDNVESDVVDLRKEIHKQKDRIDAIMPIINLTP